MFPDLLSIGPLTIHTYGFFFVLGITVGLLVALRFGLDEGMNPLRILDMGFIIILLALIGSRLAYVLMNIPYYREHVLDILKIWYGGMVFSGGLISVLLVLGWYVKHNRLSFWKIGDLWAPSAAIGQGIGYLGCFLAGCYYGKPTEVKWGVIFTHPNSLAPLGIPLHPTQIYGALSGFIIFIVLLYLRAKKRFEGQILIWFLILHSTAQLLLERFRGDERVFLPGGEMTMNQLSALLILFAAVIALFIRKPKHEEPPEPF
jgi:phosphatidylglycerol---prolipoprotein diacylglyceryl transferase